MRARGGGSGLACMRPTRWLPPRAVRVLPVLLSPRSLALFFLVHVPLTTARLSSHALCGAPRALHRPQPPPPAPGTRLPSTANPRRRAIRRCALTTPAPCARFPADNAGRPRPRLFFFSPLRPPSRSARPLSPLSRSARYTQAHRTPSQPCWWRRRACRCRTAPAEVRKSATEEGGGGTLFSPCCGSTPAARLSQPLCRPPGRPHPARHGGPG